MLRVRAGFTVAAAQQRVPTIEFLHTSRHTRYRFPGHPLGAFKHVLGWSEVTSALDLFSSPTVREGRPALDQTLCHSIDTLPCQEEWYD